MFPLSGVDHTRAGRPYRASEREEGPARAVNSFFPCSAPNTATQASNTGACTPAAPNDGCAFSATGSGKLSIAVKGNAAAGTQVMNVGASLKGLNQLCEADQLCLLLSWRATGDDCPEGSCTTQDIENYEPFGACCTVSGGVCKIKAEITAASLQIADGKKTGLELHGCGLKRGLGGFAPAIACGILLK